MSDEPRNDLSENAEPVAIDAAQASDSKGPSAESRRAVPLAVEVLAVVFLAVVPHAVAALFAMSHASNATGISFYQTHVQYIVQSLQISLPILVIMQFSGCSWREHGVVPVHAWRDLCGALLLIFIAYITARLTLGVYYQFAEFSPAHYDDSFLTNSPGLTGKALLLLVVSMAFNAFAEELAMRCYLIPNLCKLTESTTAALLLSSFLFGIYHLYQGPVGFVNAFSVGIVYGACFLRFRRIWPLVAAHAGYDIYAMLPYL